MDFPEEDLVGYFFVIYMHIHIYVCVYANASSLHLSQRLAWLGADIKISAINLIAAYVSCMRSLCECPPCEHARMCPRCMCVCTGVYAGAWAAFLTHT